MASDSPASDSLAILADVWRSGRTGALLLLSARACTEVEVVGGGLVEVARLPEVRRAAEVGRLRFELRPAGPGRTGDRAALGGLVLDLFRGRTAHPLRPVDSDDMVRLSLPVDLLLGLVADQLLGRLAHKPVAVGALVRDGSATVAELRALEALDAVVIAAQAPPLQAPPLQAPPPRARPAAPPVAVDDEEDEEEEVLAVVMEAEGLIPVPAAPALAPPPVLRLLEDEDELLALHGDDEDEELDLAWGLPAAATPAEEPEDELLALGELDPGEGELDDETVLTFSSAGSDALVLPASDLDDEHDLGLLGMPEADEDALAEAEGRAVIDWGEAGQELLDRIAAIEDRVSATGVRAAAPRGAAELDATPFGDVQTEAVWGAVERDGARPAPGLLGWGEDPLTDEVDEDPETAQDLLRGMRLAHDEPTVDEASAGEAGWSLELAPVRGLDAVSDEDTGEEDTQDGLFLRRGGPQEEETTGYRGGAFPEELSGVLQGARLRARDEITAGFQLDLINRARHELERGHLADARAALERAEVLFPGDPTVEVHLAWVDLLDGRDDGAARRAMHAVAEAPLDPVIQRLAVALAGHVGTTIRG